MGVQLGSSLVKEAVGRRSARRDGSAYVVIGDNPCSFRLRLLALAVSAATASAVAV